MRDDSGQVIIMRPVTPEQMAGEGMPMDLLPVPDDVELVGMVVEIVQLERDDAGSALAFLERQVGGMVDVIPDGGGIDFWCHDEGMSLGLTVNPTASQILGRIVCGPVVIASADEEGNTVGLPMDVIRATRRWLVHQQVETRLALAELEDDAERVVQMAEEMLRGE